MTSRGPRRPDVGRIYDALLGGKDNFAEDREAAARLIAAVPGIAAAARGATAPAAPRTEDGIARFFGGLEMVPPGLCDVAAWRAGPGPGQPGRVLFLGGIGRKQ